MGIERVAIAAKLDAETLCRIDEYVERFSPFCESRSAMVRILLETMIAAIDSGVLPFTPETLGEFMLKARGKRSLHGTLPRVVERR
jgi:hypothetical protein